MAVPNNSANTGCFSNQSFCSAIQWNITPQKKQSTMGVVLVMPTRIEVVSKKYVDTGLVQAQPPIYCINSFTIKN